MTQRAVVERGVALVLGLLFGLGFGLNYGSATQTSYILWAVKLIHPELWRRDWLVTRTFAYHKAYAELGALLLRLTPSGSAVAWANVVVIAAGVLALYAVIRALSPAARALPAFCVALILASVTRTLAPGMSYAFSELLLPSTLGAVGILAAAAAFVADRPLVTGVCLAVGGVFHVNDLILSLCVFGIALLLCGRKQLLRNALYGLGPPLLVLLWFLPFLLASVGPGASAEGQRIFQEVRLPHHYLVPRFAWDFALWIGFQLLGLAALLGEVERGSTPHRRLLLLLVGWWLLTIPSALLSSVVVVHFVRELFAWRISAEADLLAQAAFAVAFIATVCEGKAALDHFDRRAIGLGLAGVALIALGSVPTNKLNVGVGTLLLFTALILFSRTPLRKLIAPNGDPASASRVLIAVLISLISVNIARFSRLRRYSNLLSGGDPAVTGLCNWVRAHTDRDAVLLTPPDEEALRLRCERAIVIDWKTAPAKPSEVLEWLRRIEAVTGQKPFRYERELSSYDELDAERVARLRARYGFDYVVTKRGHEPNLSVAPLFTNQRFSVFRLE
ncbi:MAG TPA: DUF6798 domain-containing protein [Polyangiaceae bacterium]|jgi:hypothetical protein